MTKTFIVPGSETGSEGVTAQDYSAALNATWTGERPLPASPPPRDGPRPRGHHLRRDKNGHQLTVSQGHTSPCRLPGRAEQSGLGAQTCPRRDLTTG